jgi:hypothetical protein
MDEIVESDFAWLEMTRKFNIEAITPPAGAKA